MVLYFTSNVVNPPYMIYMGEDKYENEDLLKFAWPEDVWFHVSKHSSAHVYLRLHQNQTIDDIPSTVIDDCVQLVKANSIEGNKMNNIEVVYTTIDNLKKTGQMDVGQVGFHRNKDVKTVKVEKRINEIVNRLNKTKEERKPDLKAEKDERDRKEREDKKRLLHEQRDKEKEEEKRKQELNEIKNYTTLLQSEKMQSNKDDGNDSDDFM